MFSLQSIHQFQNGHLFSYNVFCLVVPLQTLLEDSSKLFQSCSKLVFKGKRTQSSGNVHTDYQLTQTRVEQYLLLDTRMVLYQGELYCGLSSVLLL